MHEYRLYTTIPAARSSQVQQIFAGLTASQPALITQQIVIYQQLKAESNGKAFNKGQAKPAAAAAQQQRLNYVKLVRDTKPTAGNGGAAKGNWRLRAEALPDPAANTVIAQGLTERELDEAELQRFRVGSQTYKAVSQYVASGVRFVHQSVVIDMLRFYTISLPADLLPLDISSPMPENGALLDASGAWLMETSVRVEDGGNTTLRDRAVKELEGLKKAVEGAVDLRVPDRLALDPRIPMVR